MSQTQDDSRANLHADHVDVLIVGAGTGRTLHSLLSAAAGTDGARLRSGQRRRWAPGTGTATRARASTSIACSTATTSPTNSRRNGSGPRISPPSPSFCVTSTTLPDRFDLRRDVKFDTRVTSAVFDEDANSWTLETDQGDIATAPYCIMATGSLSTPFKPAFPGIEDFGGD